MIIHCNDNDLLSVTEFQKGRKIQSKWSSNFKEFECLGDQRLFDKAVNAAKDKEAYEINRMEKLELYN